VGPSKENLLERERKNVKGGLIRPCFSPQVNFAEDELQETTIRKGTLSKEEEEGGLVLGQTNGDSFKLSLQLRGKLNCPSLEEKYNILKKDGKEAVIFTVIEMGGKGEVGKT